MCINKDFIKIETVIDEWKRGAKGLIALAEEFQTYRTNQKRIMQDCEEKHKIECPFLREITDADLLKCSYTLSE